MYPEFPTLELRSWILPFRLRTLEAELCILGSELSTSDSVVWILTQLKINIQTLVPDFSLEVLDSVS